MCGSANVKIVRPVVSVATMRRSEPGGANSVANR